MSSKKIVGILSGGLMGSDPYDPTSWSGSSLAFFNELENQGHLQRAFGAKLSKLEFYTRLALKFHPNREVWKRRHYMNSSYRHALTRAAGNKVVESDKQHYIVQLGAYINARDIYGPDVIIASYQDGNVMEKFNSPYTDPLLKSDTKLFNQVMQFEKKVAQDMDLVFTTSDYLRESFIEHYDLSEDKVINIKAGVNLTEFEDINDKTKDYSQQDILFIGKGDFLLKGGDLAIKAFLSLSDRYPDAKLHLVGPNKSFQQEFNHPNIIFYGLLNKNNEQDLALFKKLFLNCSLYIQPSRFEALGIAPIEAMLHRIPAIVTGSWALKENVISGVTGDHFEYGNWQDLADKIGKLLSSPEKLETMGKEAQIWARSEFTWKMATNKMISALENNKLS